MVCITREDKIKALRENTPTIFAPNCWGGITYHKLGLEFCSPLINMHERHDDYLKFLENPKYYLDQELQLSQMYQDQTLKRPFPVVKLGDIYLWMNHYKDFAEAAAAWERRKARIKWDNLFVMFFDEDPSRVERFLRLPYDKKICFVPWETQTKELITVPFDQVHYPKANYPFWEVINNMAMGIFNLYDDVELIFDGKYVKTGNLDYNIIN